MSEKNIEKQEIQLERLRSPAIKDLLNQGWNTAVFACGAVEQHGPHLPLFMDAEHGTFLALAVAQKIGKTLVAPTIRIGCSNHHMAFAGSLTLRKSTFEAMVSDYVSSLAHHGFKRVFIIPSHGGNFGPLKEMLPALQQLVPGVKVKAFTDLEGTIKTWRQGIEVLSGLGSRVGGHADIAETSIMLHMHPELVRMDLAEPGFANEIKGEVFEKLIREGLHVLAPNGILGDARGATPEMGTVLIDNLARHVAEYFLGK